MTAADSSPLLLMVDVTPLTVADGQRLVGAVKALQTQDSALAVQSAGTVKDRITIFGVGERQLRSVVERLASEFNVHARVGPQRVVCKETISRTATGDCRFTVQEKGVSKYAHVKLRLNPAWGGSGSTFETQVLGGAMPEALVPAVRDGVDEALSQGILAGWPMEDVDVVLYDGSYHDVDSSPEAFRIAGWTACRNALLEAAPVLLEPWMRVEASVPTECLEDVRQHLYERRARFVSHAESGTTGVITAIAPLSAMMGYPDDLTALTDGRGALSMLFYKYDVVNQAIEPDDDRTSPVTAPLKPAPKAGSARAAVPEPNGDRHPLA